MCKNLAMSDIQELTTVLAKAAIDREDHAILVAGQALAFWGEYYFDESAPLYQLDPLTSRDIDFYERRKDKVASYIEQARVQLEERGIRIKEVNYPGIEDHTIHTAILALEIPDEPDALLVDFLWSVDGLKDQEVLKGADKIEIDEYVLYVLNPILCLKSRINNLLVLYPRLGVPKEKMETEIQRVIAGIQITKVHLQDLVYNEGNIREAHKRAQLIIQIARRRMGRTLLKKHGINILDAIPSAGLNPNFYKYVLPAAEQKLNKLGQIKLLIPYSS